MDSKTRDRLRAICGRPHVTTAREELLCYSYDGTGREFLPEAVVFPADTQEISAVLKLASATPFAVVPRGAGSGMTGGSLPVEGGVVLALSRLNRILEIDEENQIAVVEPGVVTGDFRAQLAPRGLYYPPDPASLKFCTMGGNVAECAGGPSAVKYGVTRDYVLGLEVVLASGEIIHTGVRTAKGVVGYDLTRLFTGSEGTLGIITKITVRLVPRPVDKKTFLALTESIGRAASLVATILRRQHPCTLEYMDRTAIRIVKDRFPFALPEATAALLLVEVDGDEVSVGNQAASLKKLLAGENLLALKEAETSVEVAALWQARRALSPSAFKLRPHKISEDVVVPRTRIPELVAFLENLGSDCGLTIFTFGHAGDGNIHVNIMLDKSDPGETAAGQQATRALFTEVIRLGGTLSGEHGIGITKAPYLDLELDPASLEVMRGVKHFFDPKNILNPGKIFPAPSAPMPKKS